MNDHNPRLDLAERLYIAFGETGDASGVKIHAHLAQRQPLEGCGCGLGKRCEHGPPRLAAPDGDPYSLRTVQDWLRQIKARLRARADAAREEHRALAIARFDLAFAMAAEQQAPREAIAAAARRAELDGSHVAAEEAQRPQLYTRVRALMASVDDFDLPELPAELPVPLPREAARFQLQRLERLLLEADAGAARFRVLGEPPADEAARLKWRRNLLDEALHQTLTSPAASPAVKRDTIIRGAGTAAMITEGADLAERLEQMRQKLGD